MQVWLSSISSITQEAAENKIRHIFLDSKRQKTIDFPIFRAKISKIILLWGDNICLTNLMHIVLSVRV